MHVPLDDPWVINQTYDLSPHCVSLLPERLLSPAMSGGRYAHRYISDRSHHSVPATIYNATGHLFVLARGFTACNAISTSSLWRIALASCAVSRPVETSQRRGGSGRAISLQPAPRYHAFTIFQPPRKSRESFLRVKTFVHDTLTSHSSSEELNSSKKDCPYLSCVRGDMGAGEDTNRVTCIGSQCCYCRKCGEGRPLLPLHISRPL